MLPGPALCPSRPGLIGSHDVRCARCGDDGVRQPEIVQLLLEAGADVSIGDKMAEHTPLHLACVAGNVRVVQLLLEYAANAEQVRGSPARQHARAWPPPAAAIVELRVAMVRARLWQVDKAGFYPFHHAVAHKNKDVAEYLLTQGFDPNIASQKDGEPLQRPLPARWTACMPLIWRISATPTRRRRDGASHGCRVQPLGHHEAAARAR